MTSSMSYMETLELDTDEREKRFGECVSRFETDKKPVVIFEEIGEKYLDDALDLWQSSKSAVGVKTMFTWIHSKHQLVLFEIPEFMHERVGTIFADIISRRVDEIGLSKLVRKGAATTIKNDRGTGLEGDGSFQRMLPHPLGLKPTLVIEVGWTQALFPKEGDHGTSLETKAKSWMGVGVSMVLIVKLFGYREEKPGMMVCKYTSSNEIHDVRIFGTVPESVLDKVNAQVKNNSSPFEIKDETILGFEGKDLFAIKRKYQERVEQIENKSIRLSFIPIYNKLCNFVDEIADSRREFSKVNLNLEQAYNEEFLFSYRIWKETNNTVGKRSKNTKLESNVVKQQRGN